MGVDVKYTSPSTVAVSFRNLDHAVAVRKFLDEAFRLASCGGDFEMAVVSGKNVVFRQSIGHDVRVSETTHVMDVERARQEIEEARASTQQAKVAKLRDALVEILNGE